VDVQVDFVEGGAMPVGGTHAVVPTLARLVAAYRGAGLPVVHVVRLYDGDDVDLVRRGAITDGAQVVRPGTGGSQLLRELLPDGAGELDPSVLLSGEAQELGPREVALWKPRWSAFYRTRLDDLLRGWDVDTVVVVGCNFPNCPRATVFDASQRDLRVVVVPDATSQVTEEGLTQVAATGAIIRRTDAVVAAVAELPPEPTDTEPTDDVQAEAILRFWQRARVAARLGPLDVLTGPGVRASVPPPTWSFGDDPAADGLVGLVLAGRRWGAAAALAELEAAGEPLPGVGQLSILLDRSGGPRALVRTTHVDVVPFNDVGSEFANAECGDETTPDAWRETHGPYFRGVLGEERFTGETPIVCERFELLYPPAPRVRWW
jgi:uncharacterized protein YhfF/nicotinamidase-related amidase